MFCNVSKLVKWTGSFYQTKSYEIILTYCLIIQVYHKELQILNIYDTMG